MTQAIAINGSTNKNSATGCLLGKLGIQICHLREGVDAARRAILKSNIIVFGTPTYWFNVSHLMKQLLDEMEEGPKYPCEGKTAFFLAVCDEDGGQQAINQMLVP